MELINENTGNIIDLEFAGDCEGETECCFFTENIPIAGHFVQAEKECNGWSGFLLLVDNAGNRSLIVMPTDDFDTLDECLEALEGFLSVEYWQAPQLLGI